MKSVFAGGEDRTFQIGFVLYVRRSLRLRESRVARSSLLTEPGIETLSSAMLSSR